MPNALEESKVYLKQLHEQLAVTDHCLQQVRYHIQHVQAILTLIRISEQLSLLPSRACVKCATQGIEALAQLSMALQLRSSEIRIQIAAERAEIESMQQYMLNRGESSDESSSSSSRREA